MDEDFEAELYEEALLQAQDHEPQWVPPGYIPGEVEAMEEMQANKQPPFNVGPAKEAQYRDYPPPAVPPGYDSWEQFMEEARRTAEYVALVHGPGGVNEVAAAYRRMHPDPTGERRSHPGVHYEITEDHTGTKEEILHGIVTRVNQKAQNRWSDWAEKQMRSDDA